MSPPDRAAILANLMRFDVVHEFEAPPEQITAALFEPGFQSSLDGVGGLRERTVLSEDQGAEGTTRRVRCVLDIQVSGVARSMLGDADPAWVQVERWDRDRSHCDWTIEPEVGAELLSAGGTIDVAPSPRGCARSVAGEVKVRVPLYGGKVEGWIVDGVRRAYEEEARRIEAWLEREE